MQKKKGKLYFTEHTQQDGGMVYEVSTSCTTLRLYKEDPNPQGAPAFFEAKSFAFDVAEDLGIEVIFPDGYNFPFRGMVHTQPLGN